jgi:hypothetical protein
MARAGQQIENFDIGRVVSRGFEVLGAQALPFFGLALILSAPPAAMMGWWQVNLADSMQENPELALSWRFWGPFVIASAISIITNAILQATLSSAAVAHLEGDPPQIGSHLGNSIWMILPIILLSLISTLAIGLGLMLLIFPGFMLATAWAVIYPAYVRERPGIFGALARSADLTSGYRWPVFGMIVLMVIGLYIVQAGLGAVLGMLAMGSAFGPAIVAGAGGVVTTTAWIAIQASIYVELRNLKEGGDQDVLQDIFN